jgi:hypothetical protein
MALAFQQSMRHDVIMSKLKFIEKQFKVQVGEPSKKVVILITRRLFCKEGIFRLLYICEWVRYQPSRRFCVDKTTYPPLPIFNILKLGICR